MATTFHFPMLWLAISLAFHSVAVGQAANAQHHSPGHLSSPPQAETDGQRSPSDNDDRQADDQVDASTEWLFHGRDLTGWEKTNFGGEREVRVVDGMMLIESGYPLTGVTSKRRDLPTENYEIELQAKKIDGTDFFCCLTFPVGESHLSLVVGGWGGTLVGLSSLDDQDAAHNETASHMNFEPEHWYTIRIRVADSHVRAWIDEKQVVDVDVSDRKLSVRNEVLANRPLGICTFETTAGIKDIKLKQLADHKDDSVQQNRTDRQR